MGIVIRFDKFFKALLVPLWTGSGNFLYPFAIGFITALSNPWLNEKVALFRGSKQSLISFDWLLFNSILPSDPALTCDVEKKQRIRQLLNILTS